MARSAGVIFDGDDTLWETMPAYNLAKRRFFEEMELLGFKKQQVELHFEKTDIENVKRLGFSRKRFSSSMIETYHYFCRRYQVAIRKAIENRINGIGEGVVSSRPRVHGRAHAVLSQLRMHYRLILATKGEAEVQNMRIKESTLGPYFDRIYIFDLKTKRELNLIVEENDLPRKESWAVGNSLRSDIHPALEVGLKAIWIPQYTWDYEEAPFEHSGDLFTVDSLEDCLQLLIPSRGSLLVNA